MSIQKLLHSLPTSQLILRIAALLTPRNKRTEWLAEWKSELWHVAHSCNHRSNGSKYDSNVVTFFCLGAFKDALWLRRNEPRSPSAPVLQLGSPSRCILWLVALTAIAGLIAFSLPGVRKVIQPSPYHDATDLVIVAPSGYSGVPFPTVRLADYQAWSHNTHHLFTGLAFYQAKQCRVHISKQIAPELSVARSSSNLLELLNIPVSLRTETSQYSSLPRLVLSQATWQDYFHADPRAFGRIIQVAGQQAIITGVVSRDDWRLPGHLDLWLLENDRQLASLPPHTEGFVVGHVVASAFPDQSGGPRTMSVFRSGGGYDVFDCDSLAERSRQPFSIFAFTLLLACLALPATTSLPLGEYPASSNRLSRMARLRRWAFLSTKLAWILTIVYCGSLDAAYGNTAIGLHTSQYIQLATSFFGLLLAFRWALRDQRRRCPTCLRSLTNPAHVGQSSRSFLAWNGMELVCLGGHGLLHVPDIPTSWFSTQRWLALDPSWSGLFPGDSWVSAGLF